MAKSPDTNTKPADSKTTAAPAVADAQPQAGAVATQPPEVDPADAQLPAIYNYAEDGITGFEGADKNDFIVPILDILQAGSPEIVSNTIEGAKAGMFIVRALGEVFDGQTGIEVIFAGRDHKINEWGKRETGGGLKGTHDPKTPEMIAAKTKQAFGKIILENTNELVETYTLYGTLYREDGTSFRVAVPFWSTKINIYRGFMTKSDGLTAIGPGGKRDKLPMFSHRYKLRTRFIEKKGYKWWGYTDIGFAAKTALEARLDPRGDIYQDSLAFAIQIAKGYVKADMASAAPGGDGDEPGMGGGGSGGDGSTMGNQNPQGENGIPF